MLRVDEQEGSRAWCSEEWERDREREKEEEKEEEKRVKRAKARLSGGGRGTQSLDR